MRAGGWLRMGGLLCALSVAGACGGGKAVPKDGGAGIGGGGGGGGIGGGTGAGDGGLAACLEAPGTLERPPAGQLPCDLIPPGLRL